VVQDRWVIKLDLLDAIAEKKCDHRLDGSGFEELALQEPDRAACLCAHRVYICVVHILPAF
jgi:hypothetical protein